MSINETEAKRICRQSGAYCSLKAPGSQAYEFAIAEKRIAGTFQVINDDRVMVEFSLVDPYSHSVFSTETRIFSEPSDWIAFWHEIKQKDFTNQLIDLNFDPERDNALKTEAERIERVRLGQDLYRKRLMKVWGEACAVTGVKQPELLRASHAIPWAECKSGAERLSPFNGFLLNVTLDALFDKYLIAFEDSGEIIISPTLNLDELALIGVTPSMKLRFVRDEHLPFITWHRSRLKTK